MARGREGMHGGQKTPRRARWAPILAALVLALVALVAFGGMSAATAASATKHTTHTTHSTKKKPTPKPTQPAFALAFTCAEGWTWSTSGSAEVCVQTVPSATLTITVKACGKLDTDPALKGSFTANASGDYAGQYAWTWTPNPACSAIQATVKATSGGKSVTKSTSFTLQKIAMPSL